jgi:hypothetical protein
MTSPVASPRPSLDRLVFYLTLFVLASAGFGQAQQVLGSSQIQDSLDTNNVGMAEAFPVTASSSGQVNYLSLYLDNSSSAGAISVGLYTNYYSRPKTLLSQAVITQPVAGRWNPVPIPAVQVMQGKRYWVALLGLNGQIEFRDANSNWCHSETSLQTSLTSLPSTWSTGSQYSTCLVSMFGFGNTTGSVSVSVSPGTVSLQPTGQTLFSAAVSGTTNTAVTWTTSGGTVNNGGLYTAPTTAGTYTVTATSSADLSKSGSAVVTVSQPSPVSISLSPDMASLQTGGQQQFTATISGTSNTAVTWSASGGMITTSGLYTAPTVAGTYTVTAVSAANSTMSSSATVSVSAPQTVSITISPTLVAMPEKWQQQFSAAVSGSTNTGVTWAIAKGTGTISQSGLYTAPQAAETDVVTATSQADNSKSASATITVAAPHKVTLTWAASTTSGVSYSVYRGTISGGPYSLLSSGVASTSYADTTVQSGTTYYYVTSAVDSTGQSVYSNEVQAVIPMP